MKVHINKYLSGVLATALLVPSLTSCDDFLEILPLNEVVLENYWTEKDDVTSVVNSCYSQLSSGNCLKRMMVWGELRSDNLTTGGNNNYDVQQIVKENLLETNGFTTWIDFYQCINRCNTVMHYAPSVCEKDPNYTEAELKANIAEVTALRALCYFYLIRTFRDVPYVTEPSIDDGTEYKIPVTGFDEILGNIINDLERVKDDAVRSYGEDSEENTTRITRWSIYAMLADMYLWKGEYQRCIEYCDRIIDYKIKEYKEMIEEESSPIVELYGRYPLISECPNNSSYAGTAYTQIFGEGNSFESLFELGFSSSSTSVKNDMVADFFKNAENGMSGQFSAPTYLFSEAYSGNNDYFSKTDCRYLENMEEVASRVDICKYIRTSVRFKTSTTTGSMPSVITSTLSRNTANWIIYRLTDIMLMRAEAEVELAGNVAEGSVLSEEQIAHYRSAFSSVIAVWKRANNKRESTKDTLVFEDYAISRTAMEDLVMDERQRELMFEGKRWFDFVRLCRREGNNVRMIEKVLPKFKENTAAIRIRLSATDALYFPYNRTEIKSNPYIVQNPAYDNDKISKE